MIRKLIPTDSIIVCNDNKLEIHRDIIARYSSFFSIEQKEYKVDTDIKYVYPVILGIYNNIVNVNLFDIQMLWGIYKFCHNYKFSYLETSIHNYLLLTAKNTQFIKLILQQYDGKFGNDIIEVAIKTVSTICSDIMLKRACHNSIIQHIATKELRCCAHSPVELLSNDKQFCSHYTKHNIDVADIADTGYCCEHYTHFSWRISYLNNLKELYADIMKDVHTDIKSMVMDALILQS